MDEGNFAQKEKLHRQLTKIQNDDTKDKRLINTETINTTIILCLFCIFLRLLTKPTLIT